MDGSGSWTHSSLALGRYDLVNAPAAVRKEEQRGQMQLNISAQRKAGIGQIVSCIRSYIQRTMGEARTLPLDED
jgi:hypothetical protein